MKNFLSILALILLFAAGTAIAQPGRGGHRNADPEQQATHMTARMTEQLGLSEAQQTEVKAINLAFAEKMKAQHANPGPEAMDALRTEHRAALAKVLNSEQLEKLDALRPEGPGRHRGFRSHGPKDPEARQALHAEMEAYRQEHIQPVLTAQRAKLEPRISAADQAQIAALREKLRQCPKDGPQQPGQCPQKPGMEHPKGQCGAPGGGKGAKPGRKGMGMLLQDEATRKQAEQLVARYAPDIDPLLADIAPQREQWQKDRQAIREKYASDKSGAGRPHAGKKGPGREPSAFHRQLRFLLMPAAPAADAPATVKAARAITLYPNPAGATQQLEFDVLAAGKVLVEIVDRQGVVVKTVFSGDLPAGKNKLDVNTSELHNGQMYFYRITDGKGVDSRSFMVRE